MSLEKYTTCTAFEEEIESLESFEIQQERIMFEDFLPDGRVNFMPISNEYKVKFNKSPLYDESKIPLILPVKDMTGLLEYTLNNLVEHGAPSVANIIVIDDRSSQSISDVCDKFECVSYVRCDYDSGFNYAMLANIGALISHKLESKEIIFWNSDMYLPDSETLPRLILKHREHKPVISGTKLLYPFTDWQGNDLSESVNMQSVTKGKADLRGKVQYGGSGINFSPQGNVTFFHSKRGADKSDIYVNTDKGVHTTTGAYCMMDLEWLVKSGGFNPSLAKVFNDIDICLRACLQRKGVHYYGYDTFLYHEESSNLNSNSESKQDEQFTSDCVLFAKIWDTQMYNKATGF